MESTMAAGSVAPAVVRYASWGSRVWASTLDAIFNILLLIPVGIFVGLMRSDLANYAGLLLSLVYFTLGHGGATGQTWGKRVAGIRVVHESGAPTRLRSRIHALGGSDRVDDPFHHPESHRRAVAAVGLEEAGVAR